jgi:hypothetical protein
MKMATIKRTLAGLSLVAVVAGGLTFGGAGRGYASGNAVDCAATPLICQFSPTRIADPVQFVDLGITLAGWNVDGSPRIQISNLGNEDSDKFQIVERSAAGEQERDFGGLAAGQSTVYRDPLFPKDCGSPVELIISKHVSTDRNSANDTLTFTPGCGGQVATGPIG